jgi:hypothetical protein
MLRVGSNWYLTSIWVPCLVAALHVGTVVVVDRKAVHVADVALE